jgi:hypothetical protein
MAIFPRRSRKSVAFIPLWLIQDSELRKKTEAVEFARMPATASRQNIAALIIRSNTSVSR